MTATWEGVAVARIRLRWTLPAAVGLSLVVASGASASDVPIGHADPATPAADSARFRLTIGPNGRARSCAVDQSSGDGRLDVAACDFLVRRGEWQRRRDAQRRRIEYEMTVELDRSFLVTLVR
jgi:hypothetical protein